MLLFPRRKAHTPATRKTGAAPATSKESACTTSVVPTFAPSMTASAETSPSIPSALKEVIMSAVAVLLWRSAVTPTPAKKAATRWPSATRRKRRRSAPNARTSPLCTMWSPHRRSATPPMRSSSTMTPITLLPPAP